MASSFFQSLKLDNVFDTIVVSLGFFLIFGLFVAFRRLYIVLIVNFRGRIGIFKASLGMLWKNDL